MQYGNFIIKSYIIQQLSQIIRNYWENIVIYQLQFIKVREDNFVDKNVEIKIIFKRYFDKKFYYVFLSE